MHDPLVRPVIVPWSDGMLSWGEAIPPDEPPPPDPELRARAARMATDGRTSIVARPAPKRNPARP